MRGILDESVLQKELLLRAQIGQVGDEQHTAASRSSIAWALLALTHAPTHAHCRASEQRVRAHRVPHLSRQPLGATSARSRHGRRAGCQASRLPQQRRAIATPIRAEWRPTQGSCCLNLAGRAVFRLARLLSGRRIP